MLHEPRAPETAGEPPEAGREAGRVRPQEEPPLLTLHLGIRASSTARQESSVQASQCVVLCTKGPAD